MRSNGTAGTWATQDFHTGVLGRENPMLYTIAIVLIILWLLGMVSSYTMGGIIHVLLVIAVIVILVNVISGRKRL